MISVEMRTRPIWMGKTGVMLPCTIASTAIGMDGVPVAGAVAVIAGEGVITKYVGVLPAGVGLSASSEVAVGEADAEATAVEAGFDAVGTARGEAGGCVTMRPMATATESRPPASDQRARTT